MIESTDVPAEKLADELKISVPTLLLWADDEIDRRFRRGGYPAIEGMSGKVGTNGHSYLTAKLADAMREVKKDEPPAH